MARLSPEEGFKVLKDKVTESIGSLFPIAGKQHTLELKNVSVKDDLKTDDLRAQKEAKISGRTWSVPVEATVTLRDNQTGKVVDEQKLRLLNLPKHTPRYSHIVDGQEYQIDNQWRLRAGVYARVKDNGELESAFNLAKGRGFKLGFDPKTHQFDMNYGTSHIPLAPLMQELGVHPEEIKERWGSSIAQANVSDREQSLLKFYRASTGKKAASLEEARRHLQDTFAGTQLRADTTKITLGAPHMKVTGPTLLDASTKLLQVSQGKAEPDARDSLMFKELHSTEDFFAERIQKGTRDIMRRVQNTLDKKKKVRDIIGPDIFNRPIRTMYRTSLANIPEQTNPLEMLSGQMKTTITGEGGIKSAYGISEESKLIDPSHLGYLDPIHTPEGASTGVSLRLPIGVKKRGHDVTIRMHNLKTGKLEDITPEKAMRSAVVLPDQVTWEGGKPVPTGRVVKMSGVGNEVVEAPFKQADYVMRDPLQMFSMASNLIPFIAADHPNRSTMAGRHMEQAIPLANRQAPLVQSLAGKRTFESVMGEYSGHVSRVDGVVSQVKKDGIVIKDKNGKSHEVQIYDHFPLNADKSFMHSTPVVKVGDSVKKGQPVADSNFTKDGQLALGTNLKVGYMPYKGYNFEDGVVISESAAQQLSSEHLHRKSLERDKQHILNKKKFLAYSPDAIARVQADKLDAEGVIKAGQMVLPGDTLIAALRERTDRGEDRELSMLHKSLVKPYVDSSVKWEADHPGIVQEVVRKGKNISVHVKTLEPAEIGDKIAGRHGNKGILVRILPDSEMPHVKDGTPLQVLLNPTGVPGRTNLGQMLETAAGKIAEKTGKTYTIKNFQPNEDLHARVTADLKEHGISDKEDVIDPQSGRVLGSVLVGPQHIIKLKHQVEKKLVARAGGPGYAYDRNLVPKGGGPHGAQALGTLGLYSMLAHGAKNNLREFQTIKSDAGQNDEFWAALQAGEPLPAPRPTFAYKKFTSYLNALGVNVKKEGNNLQLVPFTDQQVKEMSNGEIKDAGLMVRAKDLKPEVGGLFDPKVTGGLDGTKWSHIRLAEIMPNPLFERSIQSLTGLDQKQYLDLVSGRKAVDKRGKLITDTDAGVTGGPAIALLLKKVDTQKGLADAQKALQNPNLKGNRLDQANKRVKYLTALNSAGLSPHDAYMMQNVPVLPPSMRPLSQLPNGDINNDDLNDLYKGLHLTSMKLGESSAALPEEERQGIREELYDGLQALTGLSGHPKRSFRGILDIIGGKRVETSGGVATGKKLGSPKEGFFQNKLVKRKQDLSMRSTIVPEPALGLDEVGIPRQAALEIYKPFVVRELRSMTGITPLEAQKQIKQGGELVNRALERVVSERPVLLKRDPVLHKYGIQAFKPRIVGGKAVQIHPLVTSGFNADFDGDAMSAFVPVGNAAVDEAKQMYPSRNLFSPSTGNLMYTPTLETQLGLYGITQSGKKTVHKFSDVKELHSAVDKGDVGFNDHVKIGGMDSTAGRFLVGEALPASMRASFLKDTKPLDKSGQKALLTEVATKHRNDYGEVVNKLKNLGNRWSTETAFSLGLEDIKPERVIRDRIMKAADKQAGTGERSDAKSIQAYDKATQQMAKQFERMSGEHSNLMVMHRAGIKPGMDTLRQIKMAPMLISNAKGEIIPSPVRRSYAEGLDLADYWTSMSGARKGIIQKVQQVQQPGYLSKMVMNSVMDNIIASDDCGTTKGISLAVDDRDVLDRYLAAPTKVGNKTLPAGTLITPSVRSSMRNNKVGKVVVRSPLRCQHGPGICKTCYGLTEDGKPPELGLNVGVLAGQSIGERATQLAMKSFHTGGTAATKTTLVDEFSRVQNLLLFPETLPGSATLSTLSGKVDKIEKDPAGGHNVYVNGQRHYIPQNRGVPTYGGKALRKGMEVKKGAAISRGPVNPHEMLPLTGVEPVQGYLSNELHNIYGPEGVRRRNTEVVVKALTNLTKIDDPGDHGPYIRGDFASQSEVANFNRKLKGKERPITHTPVLKGVNMLPLDMQEDWIARLNHQRLAQTVVEAAQQGWTSKLHGKHPIPPVVVGADFGRGPKPWEY